MKPLKQPHPDMKRIRRDKPQPPAGTWYYPYGGSWETPNKATRREIARRYIAYDELLAACRVALYVLEGTRVKTSKIKMAIKRLSHAIAHTVETDFNVW